MPTVPFSLHNGHSAICIWQLVCRITKSQSLDRASQQIIVYVLQCLEVIKRALVEEADLHPARRLALTQRALKILQTNSRHKACDYLLWLRIFSHMTYVATYQYLKLDDVD